MAYDINTIYKRYKALSKEQRKNVISSLQQQGLDIVKIEAYEYSEARGIKHLFVFFEGSTDAVPYFCLDREVWDKVREAIMQQ